MRLVRRPLAPGETDHELIWLSVTLIALPLAAVWLAAGLPWPHCVFLALTGHPCFTCGATRCTIALVHANWLTAWKWNPLVFVALWGLLIFDIYAFVVLVTRGRRFRLTNLSVREKNFIRGLVAIAIAANWIYLLAQPRGTY